MIDHLYIQNFKSISCLDITLKDINVLVGANSSGKSTIFQALLLLAQNANDKNGLNGQLVSMGTRRDVKCKYSDDKEIHIWVRNEFGSSFGLRINDNSFVIDSQPCEQETSKCIRNTLDYHKRNFQYLSSDRIGPKKWYPRNMSVEDTIDSKGIYAFSFLLDHSTDVLEDALISDNEDLTLLSQVNWWLNHIMNARIHVTEVPGGELILSTYDVGALTGISPSNVGAGISYIVSVLITCLSSPKNGIILVENPEIHLHPSAQARLCEFFIMIANSHRQVFIETHSDHIFNGFRVGLANRLIDNQKIGLWFSSLNNEHLTELEKIQIGRHGSIQNPRKDLFDQFDIDLNRMLGL